MNRRKTFITILKLGLTLPAIYMIGLSLASALEPQQTNTDVLILFAPELPDTPYNYANPDLPNHFETGNVRAADNTPADNPTTDAGSTLGRVLFYDRNLSANNTVSCASCHQQSAAFSDPDQFSVGFEGVHTGRNSMGLANARYYENGAFFWDERAATLEDQVLQPIQSSVEMGLTLDEMLIKLNQLDYYPELFDDAFGSTEITNERVSQALAQFVRSMVSYESKYDDGVVQNFNNFTAEEDRGRQLFNQNCDNCHETDLFIADEAANIGLDATTVDAGLGLVTGNINDDGKFKVTSLRNVELTGPYMHDGRFSTLEEVITFYSNGIQDHPNLDNQLTRRGQPRRFNFDANEQAALVAFLKTLTDDEFTSDVKFSDPFRLAVDLPYDVYLPLTITGN